MALFVEPVGPILPVVLLPALLDVETGQPPGQGHDLTQPVRVVFDVVVRPKLDSCQSEKASGPLPVIVWVHGGGWQEGNKDWRRAVPLVPKGYAVANINERLAVKALRSPQGENDSPRSNVRNPRRVLRLQSQTQGIILLFFPNGATRHEPQGEGSCQARWPGRHFNPLMAARPQALVQRVGGDGSERASERPSAKVWSKVAVRRDPETENGDDPDYPTEPWASPAAPPRCFGAARNRGGRHPEGQAERYRTHTSTGHHFRCQSG